MLCHHVCIVPCLCRYLKRNRVLECPQCKNGITKMDGGCNHIMYVRQSVTFLPVSASTLPRHFNSHLMLKDLCSSSSPPNKLHGLLCCRCAVCKTHICWLCGVKICQGINNYWDANRHFWIQGTPCYGQIQAEVK